MKKLGLGLLVLIFGITSVWANGEKMNYNIVNLSENAVRVVERDEMIVNLTFMEEGRNPVELTKKMTEKVNQVILLAKSNKQLTVTQANRHSSRTAKKTFGDTWQETVMLTIKGKDFNAINQILAQVGNVARIDGVFFSVSREAKERLENELTVEALKRVTDRANLIGKTMGLTNFRLVNLHVGSNNQYAPMNYNMRAKGGVAADAMVASEAYVPESAAGEEELSLRVDAQVQLFGGAK